VARVPLISERTDDLSAEQAETFDWVVASRGRMLRPFEVLLHAPAIARHVAELGAQIRFASSLSDHDRELAILTAARVHACTFEVDAHRPLARSAGVRAEVIAHVVDGAAGELTETEALLVGFVRELCATSTVSPGTFAGCKAHLGDGGVVELATLVGYYTLLGYVMGACDAC
jgi:4-carboxymuconolactone decarboxylase